MAGLIIEGVCATGKTTILNRLTQRESYINRKSKLQLSEHLTERVIENISPTVDERVNLLKGYVDMVSTIHQTFYNSRFKDTKSNDIEPCYLMERFHLTHAVELEDFNTFKDIDNQLSKLGVKVVILTMDENVIKERLKDTFKRRNELWYNYIMSFGGLDGAKDRYSSMQNKLLEYAGQTSLQVKVIDTTKKQWREYTDIIEDFWGI